MSLYKIWMMRMLMQFRCTAICWRKLIRHTNSFISAPTCDMVNAIMQSAVIVATKYLDVHTSHQTEVCTYREIRTSTNTDCYVRTSLFSRHFPNFWVLSWILRNRTGRDGHLFKILVSKFTGCVKFNRRRSKMPTVNGIGHNGIWLSHKIGDSSLLSSTSITTLILIFCVCCTASAANSLSTVWCISVQRNWVYLVSHISVCLCVLYIYLPCSKIQF